MIEEFGRVGIFLLGGFVFMGIALVANWLVRPNKPSEQKGTTYECGIETEGPTWVQFKVNYYMYALIFVIFDIETVFLFPWAVTFKFTGLSVFAEMLIFITILALGLWYALKKGALEWK